MNTIHPTAKIHPGVVLGDGNIIHENVIIGGFKNLPFEITIGDNNVLHAGVRVLVLSLVMGDNNVIHNHVSFLAGSITFGSDCWIGQDSELDGTGGLTVENHVSIGRNCYIWTHANSSKLLPGCLLVNQRPTIIRRGVWIVGNGASVGPGIEMAEQSILLPNGILTKDTEPKKVYGGVPAKLLNIKGWED